MKNRIIIFSLILFFASAVRAQPSAEKDFTVEKIEKFDNLFRYNNLFLGGQPTMDELKWLKKKGVTKVVNLRTAQENEEFTEEAFDEKQMVKKLGFEYVHIPVDGYDDFTPERLEAVASAINADEKIHLHCRSAGRVTNFFMAYLVKRKGFTLNKAVEVGRQLKYYNPLEDLLDTEILMHVENEVSGN